MAFSGNQGDAGTVVMDDNSLAVFLPWPLEAIGSVSDRVAIFEAFLANCPGDSEPCVGDVTGDNVVDLADLNLVLANFGQATSDGDANDSGNVDLADLNIVLGAFGTNCD